MPVERTPINIKHFANIGDAIASLCGLRKLSEKTNRKINFLQQLNVPASYYEGATHPTKSDDGSGKQVMCNQKMFDMLKPLLLAQEYINDVEPYQGQHINVDLDVIRKKTFVNIPNQAIQQWTFLAYPDMAADISKQWMWAADVDISNCYLSFPNMVTGPTPIDDLENKIIINFTERYRNHHLNYFFLQKHIGSLIFSGTETEYNSFCDTWGLFIPRLLVNNFLELAYILSKVKFVMCNQSFQWNVCEAMKIPRMLELCEYAPNCQPFIGEKSFGYVDQQGMKYYFGELIK